MQIGSPSISKNADTHDLLDRKSNLASLVANESNSGEFDRVIRTADSDESSTYEQGNQLYWMFISIKTTKYL